MYPVEAGDVVLFTVEGKLYGQQVITDFPYMRTSTGTTPDGGNLLSLFASQLNEPGALVDSLQKCMSVDVNNMAWHIQKIWPSRWLAQSGTPTSAVGLGPDPAFASNSSVAITKRAETATRGSIGTLKIPGVQRTGVVNGFLTAPSLTVFNALAAQIKLPVSVGLGAIVFTPIIYSRSTPGASPVVFNTFVKTDMRVVRRRTVGLGS